MKRGMLVFVAICAFAIAMSPKDRRAVDTEELTETPTTNQPNSTIVMVCEGHTPCAWTVYDPRLKRLEFNITNTYCICGVGTTCEQDEDDRVSSTFVYRCRKPRNGEKADN